MIVLKFSLFASILLDKSYPLCIEDYYYKGGNLYYLKSNTNKWASTSSNGLASKLHSGYVWDANNSICKPNDATILGLSIMQFNFLNALTGLFFGLIIFIVTIYLFVKVGTRK